MNPSPKSLALICGIVSSACLGVGYPAFGPAVAAGVVPFLLWLAVHRRPSKQLITTGLFVSICASAGGLLLGAAPLWMILAALLALAGWDLALFGLALSSCASMDAASSPGRAHYMALGTAVGLGLLLTAAGRLLAFQIPLGGMILLAALTLFVLERALRSLKG